jgi:hypothetical protein
MNICGHVLNCQDVAEDAVLSLLDHLMIDMVSQERSSIDGVPSPGTDVDPGHIEEGELLDRP